MHNYSVLKQAIHIFPIGTSKHYTHYVKNCVCLIKCIYSIQIIFKINFLLQVTQILFPQESLLFLKSLLLKILQFLLSILCRKYICILSSFLWRNHDKLTFHVEFYNKSYLCVDLITPRLHCLWGRSALQTAQNSRCVYRLLPSVYSPYYV
jgi:hypothetical protein